VSGTLDTGEVKNGERMMVSMTTEALITADELLEMSIPDKQVELVRGVLVVREPPGTGHGFLAGELFVRLHGFATANDLGVVLPQDTGFKIAADPDTVRAPDVAFVARERADLVHTERYAELAPDLVVEVLSPGDRPGEVLEKVSQWLSAGTRLVWILDPRRRQARVYRADGSVALLDLGEGLDGEDVLPGFSCPLEELWA